MTVHEARLGVVSMFTRRLNQNGDVVLSWKRSVMVTRSGQRIGEGYFQAAKSGPLRAADHQITPGV